VALNPIIKFTTLFGLLAVELAVSLTRDQARSSPTCWPPCSWQSPYSSYIVRSTGCVSSASNR